ncbi:MULTISPECIES: hypothetical protein [unclassified Bradyrhizobium]|uniref:hypothetical protein n=1 Tax=unclassified Bradyrhizobium TaxID=2631580 RepID=UPI002478C1B2|nr:MULTISPECIES: hypothetical protein [unclassified Bradyrhizobium]WGR69254.1 hypothetical protein MTX24_28020 [Bradyrhizobium sp. ISRA426]WGR81309.1 hypothetical protein MTX21_13135 [Bradyrhizobium sp. ISRA430]WGR84493.1 hypothetical protein MTX25_27700 [Bradyrhizobium sp. ISRA432]
MNRAALVLTTIGALGASAVAAPTPAEAQWRGFAPAVAGGLVAGAVIGGLASSAYAYGPGYGYYGYDDGYYAPAYYGGYEPYAWGGYTRTYYSTGYAPAYYGYRRVVRPAYAYYGGPFPRRHFYYNRW